MSNSIKVRNIQREPLAFCQFLEKILYYIGKCLKFYFWVNWKVINSFLIEDIMVSGFPIIVKEILLWDLLLGKGIIDNYTLSFLYGIFLCN